MLFLLHKAWKREENSRKGLRKAVEYKQLLACVAPLNCCFVFILKSFLFRTFYADRKYQRPLRMVAFLTQSVVDVFGVSGTRLAA